MPRDRFPTEKGGARVTLPAIVATCIVVGVLVMRGFMTQLNPLVPPLTEYGAKVDDLVAQGQWWRLATAGLLHASFAHIFLNCVMLGFAVFAWIWLMREERWSRVVLALALVISTSIAGFTTSFLVRMGPSIGASAAAHGMLAAVVAGVWVRRDVLPANIRTMGPVLLTVALALVLGFSATMGQVDHAAHLGGTLSGAVLGYLVDAHPKTRAPILGLTLALIALAVISAFRSPGT